MTRTCTIMRRTSPNCSMLRRSRTLAEVVNPPPPKTKRQYHRADLIIVRLKSFGRCCTNEKGKSNVNMNEEIREALRKDRTIDIITIGAKSGLPRRIEIWFTNVNGRIIICGTPDAKGGKGPHTSRDWLANLKANPEFTFCLKESLKIGLPAKAIEIVDSEDRKYLMSAPETKWYRDQVDSIEDLVNESPIVEVFFRDVT